MENSDNPTKRIKLDNSTCMMCFKKLRDHEEIVQNPTPDGLLCILKASEIRQDNVYHTFWHVKDDILSLSLKVRFHKFCRSQYTNKTSLSLVQRQLNKEQDKPRPGTSGTASETSTRRLSRYETAGFDIRSHCSICGETGSRHKALTQITTGTCRNTRYKVLEAAEKRNTIYLKMIAHPDLFAFNCKYH